MGTVVQEQDVRDAGLPVCVQDALGEPLHLPVGGGKFARPHGHLMF